jgi:hypothetical protein
MMKIPDNSTSEMTLEKMTNYVRYLGRLFDSDIEGSEELLWFQNFLDENDVDETQTFPIRSRMSMVKRDILYTTSASKIGENNFFLLFQLMPKCEEYVVACYWLGQSRKCADLLQFKRTNQGYCCTFNYVREEQGALVFWNRNIFI